MEYYRQPPSDTLHALDSTPDGLTPEQAATRLARDGRNVLTEPPKPSLVKRFFQQLADPMILVLLAAALISAVTSAHAHESFADVIIILIVVIINAVLGVYQESKAEQAIAALKELSAAHSRVLRGGKIVTVPSETLVVGDVLVLEAGDAVPADARVIESASLRAEEAALTGESVPVSKSADALHDPETDTVTGEPTEAALVRWAVAQGLAPSALRAQYPRVAEAPFDSERKMMSTLHADGSSVVQYTKGAPDVLLPLCDRIWIDGRAEPMTDAHRAEIAARNHAMTGNALRVLAAAMRTYDALPDDTSPAALEQHLCFLGLTGMIDPVRPEVVDAVRACRSAGIRPVMITGDHVDTATAIAKELGLLGPGDEAVTGTELSAMDDAAFARRLQHISVYARVQPEHKTRIVKAWRDAGFVTAMTGDGVNDAPSIRAADIGIGMGVTGTDVTKNVADMVLADDNFATIVGAVEEGRRIYDNIQRAIKFLLGSNMSEVLSIFVATMLGFTILEPVHLLWINLLTDCFPALALGMERAEPDVMSRPPRSARESIFAHGVGFDCVYQGVMCAILTLAAFFIGHYMEYGVWTLTNSPDGTTMAFLTLSMAEIFHSFNMRAHRASIFTLRTPNWTLVGAAAASLALTTLCIYVPFLADAFDFTAISAAEYAVAMGLAVLVIPVVELVKCVQRAAEKRAGRA